MDERRALLSDRQRPAVPGRQAEVSSSLERHGLYQSVPLDVVASDAFLDNRDSDDSTANTALPFHRPKRGYAAAAVLVAVFVLWGTTMTGSSLGQFVPTSTTTTGSTPANLRTAASLHQTPASAEHSLPADLALSLSRSPVDDKTLERWGRWNNPPQEIDTGHIWKESAPALHHVWRQTISRSPRGHRQLQATSSRTTSNDTHTTTSPKKHKQSTTSTTDKDDDSSFVDHVKSNAAQVTKQVQEQAGHVVQALTEDEQTAAQWAQDTWNKTAQGAQTMWNATVTQEQSLLNNLQKGNNSNSSNHDNNNNTSWINAEKEWTQTFRDRLHQLGDRIRSWWPRAERFSQKESMQVANWWNNTQHNLTQDERIVQSKFASWWNQTSTQEKVVWKETTQAFREYTQQAQDKEALWWMVTRDAAKRDYKVLQTKENQVWKKSVQWEQNVVNQTSAAGHKAWDSTSNAAVGAWESSSHAAVGAWNWTAKEEEKIWHAVQHWYKVHATYEEELSTSLLYFNSTPAFSLLTNSYGWFDYSQDFFHMQSGWDTQMNQGYCALAASAAVLNSFPHNEVSLPIDSDFAPHPYATQKSLLENSCVQTNVVKYNKTYDGVFHAPGGLSLEQTHDILKCHLDKDAFEVQMVQVNPRQVSLDEFRGDLIVALRDAQARVMVNYHRQVLDQEGTGHFSPIGAYAEREDAFLVMDVAKYKYPPAWVPAARLYASLATVDKCGDWDYPTAQHLITADEQKQAVQNKTVYAEILKKLKCQPTYRGYITVKRKER